MLDGRRRISQVFRGVLVLEAVLSLIVGIAAPSAAHLRPGRTEVVTVVDASADRACRQNVSNPLGKSSLSRNARYVAFDSERCDLVTEDSNPFSDIFVRDRRDGRTKLVSISSFGIQGMHPPDLMAGSFRPSISANGRYVAFDSDATNLVAGDTNGARDVFVHDLRTGTTQRVSLDSAGNQAGSLVTLADSSDPSISADGRFVAFESHASNLVLGDTNRALDIFVHDRRTGSTKRVSVASDGSQADEASPLTGFPPQPRSTCASISGNGRFVAFRSWAEDLVADDTNVVWDIFVHDRKSAETERVSVASDGSQVQGHPGQYTCDHDSLSSRGRYIVFASGAADLVPNDGAGDAIDAALPGDIFVHDRKTGRTERVSVTSAGEEVPEGSSHATISASGRVVAFMSWSNELTPGDGGGSQLGGDFDAYVHDRRMGYTEMVSVSSGGKEAGSCGDLFATDEGESHPAAISSDGSFVSFRSCADNLDLDGGHKAMWDEFLRDRGPALSVGQVVASGRARSISLKGSPRFARTGTTWIRDPVTDAVGSKLNNAGELLGARLTYRPLLDDVYVV
ncbi:MAG: hypothetical protein ACRDLB_06480, partial [Actinomycetota bacterium]